MTRFPLNRNQKIAWLRKYYAASAKAVCFGIKDATNAFALFAKLAIKSSDYVRSRYAERFVKFQMSIAVSAPHYILLYLCLHIKRNMLKFTYHGNVSEGLNSCTNRLRR